MEISHARPSYLGAAFLHGKTNEAALQITKAVFCLVSIRKDL